MTVKRALPGLVLSSCASGEAAEGPGTLEYLLLADLGSTDTQRYRRSGATRES